MKKLKEANDARHKRDDSAGFNFNTLGAIWDQKTIETLVELSPDPLAIIKDGVFIVMNAAAFDLMGARSRGAILGKKAEDFVHQDYVSHFREAGRKVLENNEQFMIEGKFLKVGNIAFDVEVNVKRVIIDNTPYLVVLARNISKRKALEQKLIESEEKFSKFFDYSSDAFALTNEKGRFIKWNKALAEYSGLPEEKALGKSIIEVMGLVFSDSLKDKNKYQSVKQRLDNFFRGDFPDYVGKILDYTITLPDGQRRILQGRVFPVLTSKGICFGTVSRDLTFYNYAKQALSESERKVSMLTENTRDIIYRLSLPEVKYDYINKAVTDITGYKPEEFYNDPFLLRKILHRDSIAVFDKDYRDILKGKVKESYEYKIKTRDGSIKWISQRDKLILDKEGKPAALEGIVTDVTLIREANEQLKRNLKKQVFFSEISGLLNSVDDYRIVINEILNKILDFLDAGKVHYYRFYENDGQFINISSAIRASRPKSLPSIIKTLDYPSLKSSLLSEKCLFKNVDSNLNRELSELVNSLKMKKVLIIPTYHNKTLHGFICIDNWKNKGNGLPEDYETIFDVSVQLAYSIERKMIYTKLQELNANKDKFFSIIAHDLKSPFLGFLGMAEMLSKGLENFSVKTLNRLIDELSESTGKLYGLLNNLLEWAQIQRNMVSFNPAMSKLNDIVGEAIKSVTAIASKKSITISNRIDGRMKVFADVNMIGSVVQNILNNSVKFSNRGGQVKIAAEEKNNDYVKVCVEDNGIGMAESRVKKLFKIDEKVSDIGTEGEPGSGLGLILAEEFIKMNGGAIWAESKTGVGTKMFFILPKKNLGK